MTKRTIYVTRPNLPELDQLIPYLSEIWQRKQLTNNGPVHQELELALCAYLGVKHISLVSSGTSALMLALEALQLHGEVITTPFTFVATANALAWQKLRPIFVDIDEDTLNLNPDLIEAAITEQTSGILPVHCYGTPCEVNRIAQIAEHNDLKVLYDAAHAFGVEDNGGSILRHGDMSIVSFHATKVFHTLEGGAVICPSEQKKRQIDNMKDFGFRNGEIQGIGINAKLNEISAAVGLLQLATFEDAIKQRAAIEHRYRQRLESVSGIRCLPQSSAAKHNHPYFPILLTDEFSVSRERLLEKLAAQEIYARAYFSPLVSTLPAYRDLPSAQASNLPVATKVADAVLCLPIYPGLAGAEVDRVADVIEECQHSN